MANKPLGVTKVDTTLKSTAWKDPALEDTEAAASDIVVSVPRSDAETIEATVPSDAARVSGGAFLPPDGDRYVLGAEVARGGLGRVVRAQDRRLRRVVAIKQILHDEGSTSFRFERETLLTARLQHPSIIPVYDAGTTPDGAPYYAMKLVTGRSLEDVVKGTQTLAERLGLVASVIAACDALAYAHGERVIHRDLKPANILVGEFGETVVIDWGLAKDLAADPESSGLGVQRPLRASTPRSSGDSDAFRTMDGSVMGTLVFMPPEQAAGRSADARADVFALGAVLYYTLTGAAPYSGSRGSEIMQKVLAGDFTPIETHETGVPRELATIVRKAMARSREDRYPTAKELVEDLRRFQAGNLVGAHRYTLRDLVGRWVVRHRASLAVAAAALAAIAILLALGVRRIVRERNLAEAQEKIATAMSFGLLESQGRAELLAGSSRRALVFLSAAYAREPARLPLRALVARAMRGLDAEVVALPGMVVRAVAVSPDGQWFAAARADGTVGVWSATDGAERVMLRGHEARVRTIAISRDGRSIATGAQDGVVSVWSVDGARVCTWRVHGAPVRGVGFDAAGTEVISASMDRTARTWRVAGCAAGITLGGHADHVIHAAFHGDTLVTRSMDPSVRIWGLDGTPRHTFPTHRGGIAAPAVSHDGKWVAFLAPDDTSILVHSLATGELRFKLAGHTDEVLNVSFTADDHHLLSSSQDTTAKLWSLATGAEELTYRVHEGDVMDSAIAEGEAEIVTASEDGTAKLVDRASGILVSTFEGHRGRVLGVWFAQGGKRILTSGEDGTLRLWDAERSRTSAVLERDVRDARLLEGRWLFTRTATEARLSDVASDPPVHVGSWQKAIDVACSGSCVIAAEGAEGTVRFERPDRSVISEITLKSRVVEGQLDRVGGAIVVSTEAGEHWLLDAKTRRALRFEIPGAMKRAVWSEGGDRIMVHAADETRRLVDATTGNVLATLEPCASEADSVAMRGTKLFSVGKDGRVVARTSDGVLSSPKFRGHDRSGIGAFLSTDGATLSTSSIDNTAKIWDVATGALVASLDGHTDDPITARLDGTGRLAVTASLDRTVRVWDARAGAELLRLRGHTHQVTSAWFTADGRRVISKSVDGTVRAWDVAPEQRAPDAIARTVHERVPWQLVDGRLVPNDKP